MEKRALVAVVLSIAFMYAYSYFFPQPKQHPITAQSQTGQNQGVQPATPQIENSVVPAVATPPASSVVATAKDVTVDTDTYTAVFSTQGAALKKFILKNYRESVNPDSPHIELAGEAGFDDATLVSSSKGFELSPATVYTTSADDIKVSGTENKQLVFSATTPTGVTVSKIYTFSGNSYAFDLKMQVSNTGTTNAEGVLGVSLLDPAAMKNGGGRFDIHGPFSYADDKLKTDKVKGLDKEPKTYDKNVLWSGFADKFFLRAILSQNGSLAAVRIFEPKSDVVENAVSSPVLTLSPGEVKALSYKLYFGPKDMDILKAQGNHLEDVIDLGWFTVIAKPLLRALKFFYSYTGNYGVAIIIITVILKMIFFPLTHTSYKSMKEMQKLQPKMAAIREKYKDDRDTMNRKVMELYKEHKVNPLGGCLPMLVQMPVFFALYRALMYSIELRQAPFVLWIVDLSAKDPYYITPVIMGATMFIQQKMTPSNMDPMQAKMMMMLPVVFTVIFINMPSGLVVYWLVNNILTISQQWYINKTVQV